ncbi:MAG: 4'-phosphopantetheinyl transferase superfamily protein [Terracidiphilus sp.]|jgi:4'-phosphopantetheinyl transferase
MGHLILHLWIAYPDDLLDEEATQACLQLLSEDERVRWQAFKFDRHRREYLATHALVRCALSQHRALPPEAWRFQLNAYGKPAIEQRCGLRFNLSNSLSLVVCLIAEGVEVGVDVESRERAGSIAEIGPRMFSLRELAQLDGLHEDQRPGRCLRLWTLKEAYIKARGMGLALPLNKFSFVFEDDDRIHMEMDPGLGDKPENWRFCVVEYADHCIAAMVEGMPTPELHLWESRPPFAAPRRLSLEGEIWFPRND